MPKVKQDNSEYQILKKKNVVLFVDKSNFDEVDADWLSGRSENKERWKNS